MKRSSTSAVRIGMAAVLGLAASAAFATQWGTVVSSTPVLAQVSVPQQQCYDTEQYVAPRTTGAGSVIGAVVGGVLGNAIGHGFGRAAATGVGVVAGAAIGNNVEANANPPSTAMVRQCQTVSSVENRIVGYDVVYDYAGQRYTTRMARDPGQRVPVDVNVSAAGAQPVYTQPAPVYVQPQPVYLQPQPVYAPAPVVVSPTVWVGGGWGWGGPRHYWR